MQDDGLKALFKAVGRSADIPFTLPDDPGFKSCEAARRSLELVRWPRGAICPGCRATTRIRALAGRSHRAGLYQCGHCREQFTVTVGTAFERTRIPLHKWMTAIALFAVSQGGLSARRLHREISVSPRTALRIISKLRLVDGRKPKQRSELLLLMLEPSTAPSE